MDSYWQRCVYCGLVAKKIASATQRSTGETQFLSGLLHDLGKLILVIRRPSEYEQLMRVSFEKGANLVDLEKESLGFSSADLGAQLLCHWQLPENLWKPIKHQHDPQACENYYEETLMLNLALSITNSLEPELKPGSPRNIISQLDSPAMDKLGLSEDDLNLITMEAILEALEVLNIINPDTITVV